MLILATRKRKIALCLLGSPLLVCLPFRYWFFHRAGGWVVTTDLEPEHRAIHLAEMFMLALASYSAIVLFLGLLLLFIDGYRRGLISLLLVPSALMFVFGLIVFAIGIQSYFRFG